MGRLGEGPSIPGWSPYHTDRKREPGKSLRAVAKATVLRTQIRSPSLGKSSFPLLPVPGHGALALAPWLWGEGGGLRYHLAFWQS